MEQPRPDVQYGYWKDDLPAALRRIIDTCHSELAKDVSLSWLAVEVKTENAVFGEAEYQCIRGGAILVNGYH